MASGIPNNIKIKQEPGTTPKNERLLSFKIPRDLTLGGVKTRGAPKKVYTPNLNAVRNKNTDVKTARDTTSRGRGRDRGRGDRGGRNKTRGNTFVQTSGLFSEGAAGGLVNKRSSSGGGGGGHYNSSDSSGMQLTKPTITKRDFKVDPEDELKHLHDIMGDDDEDDMDDKGDINKTMPIMLSDTKKIKQEIIGTDIKIKEESSIDEIKIKEEKDDENNQQLVKSETTNHFPEFKIKTEDNTTRQYFGYPETLEEFFNHNHQPQIFLLQLPDSLPGRPEIEPAESAEFERPTTPNPAENFCTVKQLEEGLIGKILRYKSGKTKLVLGDSRFDITLGMEPGFLQELMSINTNSEERSGNMINLGPIQAKLSAAPDWEYIFNKTSP